MLRGRNSLIDYERLTRFLDEKTIWQISSNSPDLTSLNLANKELQDEDIQAFVRWLDGNSYLTALDVSGNLIGPVGAGVLAANHTLITLNIEFNHIGTFGARKFAANRTLTTLNAARNDIGDEGIKALAGNPILTMLNVEGNDFADDSALAFIANPMLTTLDISSNGIGADVYRQIQATVERNRLFPHTLTPTTLVFYQIAKSLTNIGIIGSGALSKHVLFVIMSYLQGRELKFNEKQHILRAAFSVNKVYAKREKEEVSVYKRVAL